MRYIKLLVASVILVSMSACVTDNQSDLDIMGYVKTINIVGPEEIAFEQISGSGQTKATSVSNGGVLVFNWAVGDTLGIFPNKGNQVEFPITTQESSTSASFDGGGWALRNNASYAAYYPFSVWNYFRNNQAVILDYSGQVQDGNGSYTHLSAYDYLASAKTTPKNSTVTFQMDRQGSILYIDIVVPEPATITSLTISCDEAIFVEKAALDISGNNPVVTPIETKESLTLTFENTTTTEQNETVRAYMAVQPVDFSAKTVTATLVTDAGTYSAPVVSRVVNKGKAAFLRFSDSFTDGSTETTTPPNNEIWYTSTDENIVVPNNSNLFGATLLSNTYKDGKGVMSFDGPVTMVGDKSYSSSVDAPFNTCRTLLSISLPESVDMIGDAAFWNCYSLQTVKMPSHLVYLGNMLFGFTDIRTINIPETDDISVGNPVGIFCYNLEEITGPYASIDHRCLIIENSIRAFAPAGLDSYTIEEGITEIGHGAFWGCQKGPKLIVFPSTLKVISNQSFIQCSMETLVFPEGLERIGYSAFYSCSSLISVTLPSTLSYLDNEIFNNCTSLRSFSGKYASADGRLLVDNGSVKAFAPSGLTEYTIPEGITYATDGFDSYANLPSLESLTLPSTLCTLALRGQSITTLTSLATTPPSVTSSDYLYLPTVEAIYVPAGSIDAYKTASCWSSYADRIQAIPNAQPNNEIWYTTTDEKIVSLTENYLSEFGANLVSNTYANGKGVISFDGDITAVAGFAFNDCSTLRTVNLPESVTRLGTACFQSCGNLESIYLPDGITVIGEAAFNICRKLSNVVLPRNLVSIEQAAFSSCSSIVSLDIPDSFESMGNSNPFDCSKLERFSGKFASQDGRCLIIDNTVRAFAPAGLTNYTIPNGVTGIGRAAFWGSMLTSIVIPDSVTEIGEYAFCLCKSISTYDIPDGVTSVGRSAFSHNNALESFTGALATDDGRGLVIDGKLVAFAKHGLTSWEIPSDITAIGPSVFFYCDKLTGVTIPQGVTEIGEDAFGYCSSLQAITIPDGVTKIGESAFMYCTSLQSITIPQNVASIGIWAFSHADSITEFYVLPTVPPSISSSLISSPEYTIYVPAASVEAYKTARYWSSYADRIQAIPSSAGGGNEGTSEEAWN